MEVLWLFENADENDAIWDFRFGYQTHWGRHLHEMRVYLHSGRLVEIEYPLRVDRHKVNRRAG